MKPLRFRIATLAALLVTGLVCTPHSARADFRSGFVGWTGLANNPADAIVNFAVYQTEDNNWTNDARFGGAAFTALPGSAALSTNAFEVLFYQIVNNDISGNGESITELLIRDIGNVVTSAGMVSGLVFNDGAAVTFDNPVIGNDTSPNPGTTIDVVDGTPSAGDRVGDLAASAFATPFAASVDPTSVDSGVAGFLRFNFSGGIANQGFSSVFFITTSSGPSVYAGGSVGSGSGANSTGDLPRPNPEPGSIALVLVATLGYAGYFARNKKKKIGADDVPVAVLGPA